MRHLLCTAALTLTIVATASAHTVGISKGEYRVDGANIDATLVFARQELLEAVTGLDANRDGALSESELWHARAGIDAELPAIEVWPNQFRGYEITIAIPEYTSICPKTGLPDFGTITIRYMPAERCLELKALKYYILAYRNLGIFYENAVNRILRDIVAVCQPVRAVVTGEFNVRGGMRTVVEAKYPIPSL